MVGTIWKLIAAVRAMAERGEAATSDSRESGGGPSRKLKLSNFDHQPLHDTWRDEPERRAAQSTLDAMSSAFDTIIRNLGDPRPEREGLRKTPLRAAKALCYFTKGYEEDVESKCA